MTDREAAIAFNMTPDIGSVKLAKLVSQYGSAPEAWAAWPQKVDWAGRTIDVEREIEKARNAHVRIITIYDDEYPVRLKDLKSPPLCLYAAGNLDRLSGRTIAMVGTRSISYYGRECAENMAYGLALAGWTVVSGLAMGVDAAAHRGALMANNGGRTVGVLGSSIDFFYPSENRELGRDILRQGGCVISEFSFGRRPDTRTFPQRNRIVAALSLGVVVVETPVKGGSMITCDLAADLGRTVMAVPGPINARNSAGCHRLIREGATIVSSVDEIIESLAEFKPRAPSPLPQLPGPLVSAELLKYLPRKPEPQPTQEELNLSHDELSVLKVLHETPCHVDDVIERTGLSTALVNTTLVSLRMKRLVNFLPGCRVSKATVK